MVAKRGSNGVNPALHFGSQMRKCRQRRHWTLQELSEQSGIAVGHLSMLENGKRNPTSNIAGRIDHVFPERDGWFTDFYEDSQRFTAPGTRLWFEHEDRAREIWAWTPGALDGLVQTRDYAQALMRSVPGVPVEIAEARVKSRMERQRRVLHRDQPPIVWLLIDELALYRLVGSPDVMAMQLAHLIDLATLPHVTLHVVPAVAHGVASSVIEVTETASYAEHIGSGAVYIEEDAVASHARIIRDLQANAYRASESAEIIERVKTIWGSGVSPLTAMPLAERASK